MTGRILYEWHYLQRGSPLVWQHIYILIRQMRRAWGNSFPGTSSVNTDSWCLPVMDKLHFADQENMTWDMSYIHLKIELTCQFLLYSQKFYKIFRVYVILCTWASVRVWSIGLPWWKVICSCILDPYCPLKLFHTELRQDKCLEGIFGTALAFHMLM